MPEALVESSPAVIVTSRGSLVAFVTPVTTVVMSFAAYTFHDAPKMDPLPPKKRTPAATMRQGPWGFDVIQRGIGGKQA